MMVIVLTKAKRPAEAEKACRRALAIDEKLVADFPHEASYCRELASDYLFLTYILRTRGQTTKAEAYDKLLAETYHKLLALEPKNAVLYNNLAWLLATCPDPTLRNSSQAVALAKKAVELEPRQGMWWNTLGAALYRAEDWKGAIAALEKSMELRKGGDSFDWFFLGMAHWQLGKKEQARKWYGQGVQWMEKNQPNEAWNQELRRFRAEAAELLGIKDQAKANEKEKPHGKAPSR
jgi:Flp pilus assembly protein TadD